MKNIFVGLICGIGLFGCSHQEVISIGFCPTMKDLAIEFKQRNKEVKLVPLASAGKFCVI